jgi:hypothetical protein
LALRKGKKVLEIERGSTRSHLVENSLWKRLWTCRKTDCRMKRLWTCRKTDCVTIKIQFPPHCKETECCQYSDWATGWTTEELWFDSWQGYEIISSSERPDRLWGLHSPLFNGSWGLLEVKRPGRESEHSTLSSTEINNEWSYASTPPCDFLACTRTTVSFTFHLTVNSLHLQRPTAV